MAVEIVKTDDVWTIIHNRPEARNAMDPVPADALVAAFSEFSGRIKGMNWHKRVVQSPNS
ncbi:hypothetical protein OAN45_04845 [Burkholderiales bacterium]|nr:hypothetical protein [Burkholderiales bacterium]